MSDDSDKIMIIDNPDYNMLYGELVRVISYPDHRYGPARVELVTESPYGPGGPFTVEGNDLCSPEDFGP